MSLPAGLITYKVAFQLSPIILQGGVASFSLGQMLPIGVFTGLTELIQGEPGAASLDNFAVNFQPMPGSSLIDQEIGRYPFANQAIAANAVIANPLQISMVMYSPVRGDFGYFAKLPLMVALREILAQHNSSGGTYHILTPSYVYTNCVMRSMRDISAGPSKQPQHTWQLDFEKPLLTLEQASLAQSVLGNLLQSFTNGSQLTPPIGPSLAPVNAASIATTGIPQQSLSIVPGSIQTSTLGPVFGTGAGGASP